MAGADRMTIEEVVKKVLLEEQTDVLRSAVEAVCAQLMEVEVSELVGAERGERRPEERATHRNGYRAREWQTRPGTLELQIPKLRRGSYFPSFLEPRRRSEQALLAVIQQCYIGIIPSTCKESTTPRSSKPSTPDVHRWFRQRLPSTLTGLQARPPLFARSDTTRRAAARLGSVARDGRP